MTPMGRQGGHDRPVAVEVLDDVVCRSMARRVRSLSAHWTRRHWLAPFHTLGAAAYLDATRGDAVYLAAAAQTNDLLAAHFSDLHDRVAARLAVYLDARVYVTTRFALPGFHIYEPFPVFAGNVASLHWDRQHALLERQGEMVPRDDAVLSLTLPLSLPDGGADLQIWPQHRHSAGEAGRQAALAEPGPPEVFGYRLGVLQLHDGQSLHRASLMPRRRFDDSLDDADARITLQAHLARRPDGWELYW